MTTGTRIVGFLIAMAAVFAVAFGVGRVADPWGGGAPADPPGVHQQHTE
ncbi:hypothetical protein [Gordonia sp. SL306]|nr:hypothetical protein [Gordonia sp. SL306]WAC53636.1 hypothetical protein OVA31_12945 [Gordonia sp. SL306]